MAPSCSSFDPLAVLEQGQALQLPLETAVLDRDRGLLGKGLHQWNGGLAERPAPLGVGHRKGAEGVAAHGQGNEYGRPDPCSDNWLDQAVVDRGVGKDDCLARPDDLAGHRPLDREDRPLQLLSQQPVGRLHGQALLVGRQGQGGQIGTGQLPGMAHDERQQPLGVGPGQDRRGDRPHRLQTLSPVVGLLVEVGVLDRHPGLGGEQGQGALVVGVKVLAALLLGQVQVAVDLATCRDRSSEKGVHRRVVGREPNRTRVLGDVMEP